MWVKNCKMRPVARQILIIVFNFEFDVQSFRLLQYFWRLRGNWTKPRDTVTDVTDYALYEIADVRSQELCMYH